MRRKAPSRVYLDAERAVLAALREGHREFLRFVTSRTASLADAEDVLQEFYLKVIRSMRSVRNPATLRVWFSRILRRTLTDYYRSAAVRRRAHERLKERVQVAMRIEDDTELAVCRCLYRILPTLCGEHAGLIWRIDLLGQPRNRVAKALGVTPNTLGVRLHRARRALRAALVRYCITCPTHGFLNCACEEARTALSRQRRRGLMENPVVRTEGATRRTPKRSEPTRPRSRRSSGPAADGT